MSFYSYKLILFLCCILCLLVFLVHDISFTQLYRVNSSNLQIANATAYNLWCIFTKAQDNYKLRANFKRFTSSVLSNTTVPISFHIITDNKSAEIADALLWETRPQTNLSFTVTYHSVHKLADALEDVIYTMRKHFSSQPGSYYSDSLFFLSIGLHRVTEHNKAVMMDIDTELRVDIKHLFRELDDMPPEALVAAAPEQSPVYRHALHMFRASNRDTKFGNPLSYGGNPGLNSGVLLLNLEKQRKSILYKKLLTRKNVAKLCEKYKFHGHLGDQDWYTLISQEHPQLVHFLDCSWNRQLCLWWRHHGYHDVFDLFHYCPGKIKVYHGNCNTEIPSMQTMKALAAGSDAIVSGSAVKSV